MQTKRHHISALTYQWVRGVVLPVFAWARKISGDVRHGSGLSCPKNHHRVRGGIGSGLIILLVVLPNCLLGEIAASQSSDDNPTLTIHTPVSHQDLSADEVIEALLASPEWTVECTPEESANRDALLASVRRMTGEARYVAARLLERLPLTYTKTFTKEYDQAFSYMTDGSITPERREQPRLVPDHLSMDVEIFEDTVNLALQARNELPWCAELDMDVFIRYVVVHRGTTETLENWRAHFWYNESLRDRVQHYADQYREAAYRQERSRVIRQLVYYLNTEYLANEVSYEPRGMPDLSPNELMAQGTGRCTDLTNALMAICRTFGLAVAGVRTIWWPRSDSNHFWAAIYDPAADEWLDVDGADGGEYSDAYFQVGRRGDEIHAKLYWLDMDAVRGSIRQMLANDAHPTPIEHYLVELAQVDMTERYTPVGRIEQQTSLEYGTPAYLCVFNSGMWREVAATRVDDGGRIVFDNVGCRSGVLYLVRYNDPETGAPVPIGRPGVLRANAEGAEWTVY